MSDYACNMWRLVKGEEDVFPHKNYYSLDPYTIYLETSENDKNEIVTIFFPLSHLLELKDSKEMFLGFKIGEEQTFIAKKERIERLIDEGRLLEFPHYTGGSCETVAIHNFNEKKVQTFIGLFSNCIETLEGMLK